MKRNRILTNISDHELVRAVRTKRYWATWIVGVLASCSDMASELTSSFDSDPLLGSSRCEEHFSAIENWPNMLHPGRADGNHYDAVGLVAVKEEEVRFLATRRAAATHHEVYEVTWKADQVPSRVAAGPAIVEDIGTRSEPKISPFLIAGRAGVLSCGKDFRATLLPGEANEPPAASLAMKLDGVFGCYDWQSYSDGDRFVVAGIGNAYVTETQTRVLFVLFDFELFTTRAVTRALGSIGEPPLVKGSLSVTPKTHQPMGVVKTSSGFTLVAVANFGGAHEQLAQVELGVGSSVDAAGAARARTVVHSSGGFVTSLGPEGTILAHRAAVRQNWLGASCGCGTEVGFRAEAVSMIGDGSPGHFASGTIEVVDIIGSPVSRQGQTLELECLPFVVVRYDGLGRPAWAANLGPWSGFFAGHGGRVYPTGRRPPEIFEGHVVAQMSSAGGKYVVVTEDRILRMLPP